VPALYTPMRDQASCYYLSPYLYLYLYLFFVIAPTVTYLCLGLLRGQFRAVRRMLQA